jgi:hypothetical protein
MNLVNEGKAMIEELQQSTKLALLLAEERAKFLAEDYLSGIARYAMQGEQSQQDVISALERKIAASMKLYAEANDRCGSLEVELCLRNVIDFVADSSNNEQLLHDEDEAVIARDRISQLASQLEAAHTRADILNKDLTDLTAQSEIRMILSELVSDVCTRSAEQVEAAQSDMKNQEIAALKEKLEESSAHAKTLTEKFKSYKTRTEVRLCIADTVSTVCDRYAAASAAVAAVPRVAVVGAQQAGLVAASTRASMSLPSDHIPIPVVDTQEQSTQTDAIPVEADSLAATVATTAAAAVAAAPGGSGGTASEFIIVTAEQPKEAVTPPRKPELSPEMVAQMAAESKRVKRLEELRAELVALLPHLSEAQESLAVVTKEKNEAKAFIKKWVDDFEKVSIDSHIRIKLSGPSVSAPDCTLIITQDIVSHRWHWLLLSFLISSMMCISLALIDYFASYFTFVRKMVAHLRRRTKRPSRSTTRRTKWARRRPQNSLKM